ncbi:MAG: hypothetical protein Q9227_005820 [Pyrenula ochraceoflavens]
MDQKHTVEGQKNDKKMTSRTKDEIAKRLVDHLVAKAIASSHQDTSLDGRPSLFEARWPGQHLQYCGTRDIPKAKDLAANIQSAMRPHGWWLDLEGEERLSPLAMKYERQTLKYLESLEAQLSKEPQKATPANLLVCLSPSDAATELRTRTLLNQAHVNIQQKQYHRARQKCEAALELALNLKHIPMQAKCNFWLGVIAHKCGKREEAAKAFLRSFPCVRHHAEAVKLEELVQEYKSDIVSVAGKEGLWPNKDLDKLPETLEKAVHESDVEYEALNNEQRLKDLAGLSELEKENIFARWAMEIRESARYQRILDEFERQREHADTFRRRTNSLLISSKLKEKEQKRLEEEFGDVGLHELLRPPWWDRAKPNTSATTPKSEEEDYAEQQADHTRQRRIENKRKRNILHLDLTKRQSQTKEDGSPSPVPPLSAPIIEELRRPSGNNQQLSATERSPNTPREMEKLKEFLGVKAKSKWQNSPRDRSGFLSPADTPRRSIVSFNRSPETPALRSAPPLSSPPRRKSVPSAPSLGRRPSHPSPSSPSPPLDPPVSSSPNPPSPLQEPKNNLFSTLPPSDLTARQRELPKPAPIHTSLPSSPRRASATPVSPLSPSESSSTIGLHPPSPLKHPLSDGDIVVNPHVYTPKSGK